MRTFRSASGSVVLVVSALLALFLLGDAVLRAGWGQMLLLAPWVLLGLWVVYVAAFVSVVRIDDEGVAVQNLLRKTTCGWRCIRDIDLRWQLVFALDDGTDLACYGGPVRARQRRTRTRADEELKTPPSLQDLTDIRDRWAAADVAASTPIRRGWDRPAVIVLGVIIVWAVLAIFVANAG